MGNRPSRSKSTRRLQAFGRSSPNDAPRCASQTAAAFPAPPPVLNGEDGITSKPQTDYETRPNTDRQGNVMKMLANYNTVFLVDDSLSMEKLWDQVSYSQN